MCLNLTFDGQGSSTRVGNKPDDYLPASGDIETINTVRVIIVRQYTENEEGNGTISRTGFIEANRLVRTNDLGQPLYDNLEFKVVANEKKRVYLIANEQYLEAPAASLTNNIAYSTASNYLDSFKAVDPKKVTDADRVDLSSLSEWTVSIPGITAATTEVNGYSNDLFCKIDYDKENKTVRTRRIPLTEYFDISVDRIDNVDDMFYSHLFITRAAAKARFYLNTSDNFAGDEFKNTYIKAISLSGLGTTEYVFPNSTEYSQSKESLIQYTTEDLPANDPKKTYITTFATPTTDHHVTYIINNLNVEIKKPVDGQKQAEITSPVYFPESILEPGQHYKVGVQLSNGEWLYADLDRESLTHNILTIKDGDVERDAIARNTYLPIELYFDGAMDLSVNVLPWNREDYYVDYTANVGFTDDGYLKIGGTVGQTGDYLSLSEERAELVLNYGKVAMGSFTIASPKDCKWDAYLITTGGEQDAIQFQIPDPEDTEKTITTTHISGYIDPQNLGKADFGIVATVEPGIANNTAELLVIVTLADGTSVMANVIGDWKTAKNRLTIIENRK